MSEIRRVSIPPSPDPAEVAYVPHYLRTTPEAESFVPVHLRPLHNDDDVERRPALTRASTEFADRGKFRDAMVRAHSRDLNARRIEEHNHFRSSPVSRTGFVAGVSPEMFTSSRLR